MSDELPTMEELADIQKAIDDQMAGDLLYVYKSFLEKLLRLNASRCLHEIEAGSGLTEDDREQLDFFLDHSAWLPAALATIDSLAAENAKLKEQLAAKERECEELRNKKCVHDLAKEWLNSTADAPAAEGVSDGQA
jgi:hypothetical protein